MSVGIKNITVINLCRNQKFWNTWSSLISFNFLDLSLIYWLIFELIAALRVRLRIKKNMELNIIWSIWKSLHFYIILIFTIFSKYFEHFYLNEFTYMLFDHLHKQGAQTIHIFSLLISISFTVHIFFCFQYIYILEFVPD